MEEASGLFTALRRKAMIEKFPPESLASFVNLNQQTVPKRYLEKLEDYTRKFLEVMQISNKDSQLIKRNASEQLLHSPCSSTKE